MIGVQNDWKYTLYAVFIRHIQNMRCHNSMGDYKFHGDRRNQ